MHSYKIYAAGILKKGSESLDVVNPYTNLVFASVDLANEHDLEEAISVGLSMEERLAEWPLFERTNVLRQIVRKMEEHQDELAQLIVLETAKPIRYAKGEVARAIQTFEVAAEECRRIHAEHLTIDWTPAGVGKEAWIKRFPIGLVAGIAPFNFPLNLSAHKIAPALAAGNPVILKPASQTPVSMLRLAELIDQTDLPKGALSVLPMRRALADKLVTDERVKMLSFTGSPAVGWPMKNRAGKKKVALELGGNAGVYVAESADLETAVKKCVIGGFAFSGQVCIHVQRIYVHESVFIPFSEQFVQEVEKIREGDPLHPETEIAPLIDQNNAIRVEQWVQDALDMGAKKCCGGERKENYYPPTVLCKTNQGMKVCSEEIFGPVVTLEKVSSCDEAIELINDSKFGLQAGLFTNHLDEMNMAYRKLKVGGVVINDIPTFRVDHMPYGGVKDSGTGREGVRYAIEEMTEPKLLIKPM